MPSFRQYFFHIFFQKKIWIHIRSFDFEFQTHSKANLPVNLEILSSSPLLVCEGGHVLVTSDNIAMVLDIAKYGVEEDGVIFTLITPPTYGTLTLDLLTTRTEHSFTLRDIDQDKVNKFSTLLSYNNKFFSNVH